MMQRTSVEAYRTITENGLLSRRRQEVYAAIHRLQPVSINTLIAQLSVPGRNTSSISARTSELQRLGVIAPWGTEIAPTGHEVMLWRTTENLPGKIEPKPTRKELQEKIATLEGEVTSAKLALLEIFRLTQDALLTGEKQDALNKIEEIARIKSAGRPE